MIPFIDFKVLHDEKFYGFNSVSLYKLLPKLREKEGTGEAVYVDSEDTILDVDGLENQLIMLREKKRREAAEKNGLIDEEMDVKDLAVPPELGNLNMGDNKEEEFKF